MPTTHDHHVAAITDQALSTLAQRLYMTTNALELRQVWYGFLRDHLGVSQTLFGHYLARDDNSHCRYLGTTGNHVSNQHHTHEQVFTEMTRLVQDQQSLDGTFVVPSVEGTDYRCVIGTWAGYPGQVCAWPDSPSWSAAFELGARLFQRELQWQLRMGKAEELVYIDDLTGLFNVRYLDKAIDRELRRASRFQGKFSLLFIDLDRFKTVNDTKGHLVGSLILQQVGRLLLEQLREVDISARYGGDEFVIILIGTDSKAAKPIAERLRRTLSASRMGPRQQPIQLTASIGIASYPEHGSSKSELLRMADRAMYDSKQGGKDRVTIYSRSSAPGVSVGASSSSPLTSPISKSVR